MKCIFCVWYISVLKILKFKASLRLTLCPQFLTETLKDVRDEISTD